MKVTLKQAFSILDGRLSTKMDDIYEMLSFVFSENLFTHQLPSAMRAIQATPPQWFIDGVAIIDKIKETEGNDFHHLMEVIDRDYADTYIELEKLNIKIPFI